MSLGEGENITSELYDSMEGIKTDRKKYSRSPKEEITLYKRQRKAFRKRYCFLNKYLLSTTMLQALHGHKGNPL